MTTTQKTQKLKIVLVGDGGVGKTSFAKKLRIGEFTRKYIPTMGIEVHPVVFNTNKHVVIMNFWDTAGQERFGGLKEGYYINGDAFLVFYDITNNISYKNVPNWVKNIKETVGKSVPIFIVGTKSDRKDVKNKDCDSMISTRTCDNLYDPILKILKNKYGKDTILT